MEAWNPCIYAIILTLGVNFACLMYAGGGVWAWNNGIFRL